MKKNATSFELDGDVDKESSSYSRSLYFSLQDYAALETLYNILFFLSFSFLFFLFTKTRVSSKHP